MKIREIIVDRTAKNLLGPVGGPYEELLEKEEGSSKINPGNYYIIGILGPLEDTNSSEEEKSDKFIDPNGATIDDGSDLSAPLDSEDSDDGSNNRINDFNPLELSPYGLPSNMGLSFFLRIDKSNNISICLTWGTYNRIEKESSAIWKRESHYKSFDFDIFKDDPNIQFADDNIRCYIRVKKIINNDCFINVSLINIATGSQKEVENLIFQPQIRIFANDNTLLPFKAETKNLELNEDNQLERGYNNLRNFAKGRNSSAIWKEVDPLQNYELDLVTLNESPIFGWPDNISVPNPEKEKFLKCDIRTEWIPSYQIKKPKMITENLIGKIPNPETLSSLNSDQVDSCFRPFLTEFLNFINKMSDPVRSGTDDAIIRNFHLSYDRMKKGILLLKTDQFALTAFQFANKAMSLQQQWTHKRTFDWYPFQLGFILINIEGLANDQSPDRKLSDLLWFPTGGGKTEAYLVLVAFTLVYRRLKFLHKNQPNQAFGTGVISRYTLRLLTIQQFRRASKLILAMEFLRLNNWNRLKLGEESFSLALWVGGNVTPNKMKKSWVSKAPGALEVLREFMYVDSEPAQITYCPICSTEISLVKDFYTKEPIEFYYLTSVKAKISEINKEDLELLDLNNITATEVKILKNSKIIKLYIELKKEMDKKRFIEICKKILINKLIPYPLSTHLLRPGYFYNEKTGSRTQRSDPFSFSIICPNPLCESSGNYKFRLDNNSNYKYGIKYFEQEDNTFLKFNFPIYTVDEEIYSVHPSFIISTVDKFARMPFKPEIGALFGKINKDSIFFRKFESLRSPDLLIQDELHLIEGPLGSLTGLYEHAISFLCEIDGFKPKYITATATIKKANDQIGALFRRELQIFPPLGLDVSDNFFSTNEEVSQREEKDPSRLYIGICPIGISPQTSLMYLYGSILQVVKNIRDFLNEDDNLDPYWTVIGYYNSIREMSGALNLLRQETVTWIQQRFKTNARTLEPGDTIELSGRKNSTELPIILKRISEQSIPSINGNNLDNVVATSILGTGIDIDRLGLMLVNGQPKTTSQYIQSTGRVGRQHPGIVFTYLRPARIRDMDHFESFVGFHRSLYKSVEPVPLYPLSPGALEKALGPVLVSIIRNIKKNNVFYIEEAENDPFFILKDENKEELDKIIDFFVNESILQPKFLRPREDIRGRLDSAIDGWYSIANGLRSKRKEFKYTNTNKMFAETNVVLGDYLYEHEEAKREYKVVFRKVPNSLRTMEPTMNIKT